MSKVSTKAIIAGGHPPILAGAPGAMASARFTTPTQVELVDVTAVQLALNEIIKKIGCSTITYSCTCAPVVNYTYVLHNRKISWAQIRGGQGKKSPNTVA